MMMTFKMRAEGVNDVFEFVRMFSKNIKEYRIIGNTIIPDVEFEFETKRTLNTILNTLRQIPDSHVMVETVKPISEYTGVR
jgi:predicted transport protein